MKATKVLNFFQTSTKNLYWSSLIAFVLALFSFTIWHQVFTFHNLPVQILMAAPGAEYVKVYWDDPERYPTAYERININPVISQTWQIKIESTGEKNPQSSSAEVWILDISTPRNRVDWSKAVMSSDKLELRDDPNGSQGKVAIAYSGKPQFLSVPIEGGDLTIKLLRHSYSGKVKVTVNDQVREIDLFDPNSGTESLTFFSIVKGDQVFRDYEIKLVDTAWHRLKFMSDSNSQVNIENINLQNNIISLDSNQEYVLPFKFWNRSSCAILATIISFFWMTILFVSLVHIWKEQNDKRFSICIFIILTSFTLGGFWMLVFYPALMSADSLSQWSQALDGKYTDWNPIGMTILMRLVVILFPDFLSSQQVAVFAFLQGSLFWMAIFYTIYTFLPSSKLKNVVLLLFFLYYPLWTYTSTLWKDVWASTWLLVYTCEIYNLMLVKTKYKICLHLLTSSMLCCMAILTRQTSFLSIALFLFFIAIAMVVKNNVSKLIYLKKFIPIISSLIIGMLLSRVIYLHFNVAALGNHLNVNMSYDLIGTLHFSEKNVDDFKFLTTYQKFGKNKLEKSIKNYWCGGSINYLLFTESATLGKRVLLDSDTILTDMSLVLPQYLGALIKHKVCAISALLQINTLYYPHQSNVLANNMGIVSESRLPNLNKKILIFLSNISNIANWTSVFYRHGIILCIAITSCVMCLTIHRRIDDSTMSSIVFLLMSGVCYFLPYLIIVPAPDWRYLLFSNITWMLSSIIAISSLSQILTLKVKYYYLWKRKQTTM